MIVVLLHKLLKHATHVLVTWLDLQVIDGWYAVYWSPKWYRYNGSHWNVSPLWCATEHTVTHTTLHLYLTLWTLVPDRPDAGALSSQLLQHDIIKCKAAGTESLSILCYWTAQSVWHHPLTLLTHFPKTSHCCSFSNALKQRKKLWMWITWQTCSLKHDVSPSEEPSSIT